MGQKLNIFFKKACLNVDMHKLCWCKIVHLVHKKNPQTSLIIFFHFCTPSYITHPIITYNMTFPGTVPDTSPSVEKPHPGHLNFVFYKFCISWLQCTLYLARP